MKRVLVVGLLSGLGLLLPGVPAHAAKHRQPLCVKGLKFVHYSVRVAKAPGGGVVACQGKTRKSYQLGNARNFNAAGRYLTYVAPGRNGGKALRRLDIRTGAEVQLDRGGENWTVGYLGAMPIGFVAWASVTDGSPRFRLYDEYAKQVQTVVAGAGLDAGNFAFSGDVTPYWTQEDATPKRTDTGFSWPGTPHYALPAYKPSKRPRCKQNLVFLRGPVRVVRASSSELVACGPQGKTLKLGPADDLVAAGPWLVYSTRTADESDLLELNVRTGERRHLKAPGGFNAFFDGLLPDGTVAWTDLDFTTDAVLRAIRIWPAGEDGPITVEESESPRSSPDYEGIDPGTVALASDGTLYWRDETDTVLSRPPAPAR